MTTAAPTLRGFLARLVSFVVAGGALGSTTVLAFYRLTLQATPADQKIITAKGFIITVIGGLIYLTTILLICRPLMRFARGIGPDQKYDDDYLSSIQDQAMKLGPKMAALGFIFYTAVTPVNLAISFRSLDWPLSTLWFGVGAGLIAGLLLMPLALNLANWAVRPIVDYSVKASRRTVAARRAGWPISLRMKLLFTFGPLILAGQLFGAAVGYSQTQGIFENQVKLQRAFVPPGKENLLIDTVLHRSDPGIRSTRYYQSHLGDLILFYSLFMSVTMAVGLVLILLFAYEISLPVKTLNLIGDRIKLGNFLEPIRLVTSDEFADLGSSLNRMMDTIVDQMEEMARILNTLRDGVAKMDETANTVLAVSAEQSSGATEQASSVQETGSIAEEIVATARQISERAKSVDKLAGNTLNASLDGEKTLDEASKGFAAISDQVTAIGAAMTQLETRFQETYKIVEWMEDIAEQTELLSLNAALEAAGAGEEGRRFSVVAQATRRLAQRAAEAANEIRTMIESIQQATVESTLLAEDGRAKVEKGGTFITAAVSALKTISDFAQSTSSSVREITMSTNQQTTASEQLAGSVAEVQEVARRIEEGAKEIESAIAGMRDFAEELRATVETKA
ncbi:MAG TPA: methyl-accepting chemotaxis protein [bacterium]|nr:methyl-accepting chemotaxis protein [bacterium]